MPEGLSRGPQGRAVPRGAHPAERPAALGHVECDAAGRAPQLPSEVLVPLLDGVDDPSHQPECMRACLRRSLSIAVLLVCSAHCAPREPLASVERSADQGFGAGVRLRRTAISRRRRAAALSCASTAAQWEERACDTLCAAVLSARKVSRDHEMDQRLSSGLFGARYSMQRCRARARHGRFAPPARRAGGHVLRGLRPLRGP